VERSLDPFPGKREPTRVSKTRVRSHLVKISNSVSPKAGNPSMVGECNITPDAVFATLYANPRTVSGLAGALGGRE